MTDKIPPRPDMNDYDGPIAGFLFVADRVRWLEAVAKVAVAKLLKAANDMDDVATDVRLMTVNQIISQLRDAATDCREALRQIEESGWTP